MNSPNQCRECIKLLMGTGGSPKSQFKKADKSGARLALVVGDEELKNNQIAVKYLREEKEQITVNIHDFVI